MIDSESVKIIAHLNESLVPPFKIIYRHLFPIVSGKAPILSFDGKIIRWRTGLQIEMEEALAVPMRRSHTCKYQSGCRPLK